MYTLVDVIIIGISGYFVCKNTNYILLEEKLRIRDACLGAIL